MQDNSQIAEIVKTYLSISAISLDMHQELAEKTFEALQKVFKEILNTSDAPIVLPYKDISDIIFSSSYEIKSNSLEGFSERVNKLIEEYQQKPYYKNKGKKLYACHKKLIEHILLAQAQKDFIQKSIYHAQEIARTAEGVAKKAEGVAKKAEETAKKAEETYKSMFANYVTILGIFTAIIVTIFGGLNVIGDVFKQENTEFQFRTIIFLVSLALMCVVCLLYFLAKIIQNITQRDGADNLGILFGAIITFCAVSMGICIIFEYVPKLS